MKSYFSVIYYLCNDWSFKTFPDSQHYQDTIFSSNEVWPQRSSKVIYFMPKFSSSFVYWPILIKIFMNDYIMRHNFPINHIWPVIFMLWISFVNFRFKTFWPNYNWLTFLWTTFVLVFLLICSRRIYCNCRLIKVCGGFRFNFDLVNTL